ncbi:hypothetical protein [Pleionea sp. CnH1-48]|uniref:hypothetical protein n=1 Tax=Pleionea sp. CnH1-48 TaxID=2954494 RepID=UPI0020977844|nr:hypothetical protein [Pleionea sp. CnH1-48]MCO7222724.1 hypothetical protein [Pleionea sp. CnH1-48]
MNYIIAFKSNKFDVSKENKNPINPIYGESLLSWLKVQVKDRFDMPDPEPEDWGWYTFVECNGRSYLVGSSATKNTSGYEWELQIDKQRTLKEKLFGQQKMTKSDVCLNYLLEVVKSEGEFTDVMLF